MASDEGPILVPLDGSKNAERAVPHAISFANLHSESLRFVHVADENEVREANLTRASEVFASYVKELLERYRAIARPFTAELLSGSPADILVNLARTSHMVVLASHGRGGFHATFVGSVADKLIRGSPVPVLIAPSVGDPPCGKYERILVALDGSPISEMGLAAARQIAEGTGAHLTLVRAYMTVPYTEMAFVNQLPSRYDVLRETSEDYLEELAGPGEEWTAVQASAPAGIELIAREIGADLVVMTGGGKELGSRITLGSTTDRVMHSLHRPILIVPVVSS